ncbi:MAG: hypothetical protein WC356_02945 [Candidatus Micrarchaeia archaeon]|jgi:predicted HTH transcriptional regulator
MPDCRNQLVIDFSQNYRRIDPATSEVAGKAIVKSGKANVHCQIILNCLRQNNGSTVKELQRLLDGRLKPEQVHKRMADLKHNGFVKRDDVITRDGCATWWIL